MIVLKKTIRYTDFNGQEREEDFYFNITEADIAEMAILHAGGIDGAAAFFKDLADSKDPNKLIPAVKNLLTIAYGERSEDGVHFRKSQKITDDFVSSAAYPEIFVQLVTDIEELSSFFLGALPARFGKAMKEGVTYTTDELMQMDDEQFDRVAGSDVRKMDKNQLAAAMARRERSKDLAQAS